MRKLMLFTFLTFATLATPALADNTRPPRLKIVAGIMVNDMMTLQFDERLYNYNGRTDAYGRYASASATSVRRERTGWGLAAQWSPDGKLWVEASWQRPERVKVALDTSALQYTYGWPCGWERYCPARVMTYQLNEHSYFADDFALGLLYDLSENKHKHFSLLVGAGVHRRYTQDNYRIRTESGEERTNLDGRVSTVNREASVDTGETTAKQTRIYGQVDLELYPAGKDAWFGLVLSTRVLSDGGREQNFPTDTVTDKNVFIGIQPGAYDVTARFVLRF